MPTALLSASATGQWVALVLVLLLPIVIVGLLVRHNRRRRERGVEKYLPR
ncbi:hypothetical protein K8W59_05030 [Nocardioides rotundus]|nr:hypothetical protein [Nocardioides rotundus]UAL30868.1 hypothetical protein K8W59_05030 [Nocardioides rotundus]